MNEKQFIGRFLMWYYDSTSLPDKVNEERLSDLAYWARALQARHIKKAVKKIERDSDSYRRVIKKYHLKTGKILEKSQKKCKNLKKRISKFL